MAGLRLCAICDDPAGWFCPADDVFLCEDCDEQVHEANMIARYHSRTRVLPEVTTPSPTPLPADSMDASPSSSLKGSGESRVSHPSEAEVISGRPALDPFNQVRQPRWRSLSIAEMLGERLMSLRLFTLIQRSR